jgi:uncharacterized protein YjeT (DUF2065 family)
MIFLAVVEIRMVSTKFAFALLVFNSLMGAYWIGRMIFSDSIDHFTFYALLFSVSYVGIFTVLKAWQKEFKSAIENPQNIVYVGIFLVALGITISTIIGKTN